MTAPEQVYGYAHRGTVVGPAELDGYWMVRCTSINPARPIGPYASIVPSLNIDDRVLLTQIGTTRDDLVITGVLPAVPWDANLPIGIDDVTGLQAELDDRATDTELSALETATNLNFLVVNSKNDEQDGRLDDLEAADVTLAAADAALAAADTALAAADTALDGRLDVVEPAVTANTAAIAVNAAAITTIQGVNTTQDARILELEQDTPGGYDNEQYGDLISPFPRRDATNVLTTSVSNLYFTRMRAHADMTASKFLIALGGSNPVGAGTVEGAAFTCATRDGTYARVAMTPTGLAHTVTGVYVRAFNPVTPIVITQGTWVMLAVRVGAGYSSPPRLCTTQGGGGGSTPELLNPGTARIVGHKASVTVMPASISPNDGTWAQTPSSWWIALAP